MSRDEKGLKERTPKMISKCFRSFAFQLSSEAQAEEQAQEISALQEQLQSASTTPAEALDGPWSALTGRHVDFSGLWSAGDGWRQKPSMSLGFKLRGRVLSRV